jgi:hypothetical protein
LRGGVNLFNYVGNNPISLIDPYGLDWLDNLSNLSAGFGDTLTSGFGLINILGLPSGTEAIRNIWNKNIWSAPDQVCQCSGWYSGGKWGAYTWATATVGVAGLYGGSSSVYYAGNGARAIAEGLGTTIGQTPIGAALNALGVENPIVWTAASSIFAANASGTATAVINYVSPNSIWLVEQAILNLRNIPIIYH